MSPDGRVVHDLVARARRRAVALLALDASAWAIAAAAVATIVAVAAGWPSVPLAIAAAAGVGVMRFATDRRRTSTDAVVLKLERIEPAFRNLLVTASELQAGPSRTKPWIRQRVLADAAAIARVVDIRAAWPVRSLGPGAAIACGVWIAAAVGMRVLHSRPGALASLGVSQPASHGATAAAAMTIDIVVSPPAYTHLPTQHAVDPPQVQALEGSTLTVSIGAASDRVSIDHDGITRSLTRDASGRFVSQVTLERTGYLIADAANAGRRTMPIVVVPDARPTVTITAPGRDLVYAGGNARIAFAVRAVDDLALGALALRFTKVSGSGEQFEFGEGEIPLTVARDNARQWRGDASRSLSDLNLRDGDMLVYRAVASDARPGGGEATSDAFFIEISKLAAAAGEGFTLPEAETKYALSQQMILMKTERLERSRASMARDEFTERALQLAAEQRMVRAEFVFMLGGEVEDEEVEAEQSTELQEGRLANRGQTDLRAATRAMTTAEKLLTAADTAQAVRAEREAVRAIERAFARDRYILRAAPNRSRIDPSRRLTGDLSRAGDWIRRVPDPAPNRRALLLQDVLRGLGEGPEASRLLVLAEETLRIDPTSAAIRQAASGLQHAADTWGTMDPRARERMIAAVASAVADEAKRALAGAPVLSNDIAPALSGKFSEALRTRGAR